jgi:hypothetical protein
MAKKHRSFFFVHVTGALLLGLGAGCAEQHEASPSEGDLADLEASLAATTSSLASTDEAVEQCFTDFRSCAAAATLADERASCREELTACLPEQPLGPRECSADAGAAGPGRGFGGRRGPGQGRPGPGFGFGNGPRFGGDPVGDVDAGAAPSDNGEGGFCAAPFVPRGGGFGGCAGRARDNLAGGGEPGAVASFCRACVREAFEERIAELCQKAAELCAADDAPERICARVTAACADVDAPANDGVDAGTP